MLDRYTNGPAIWRPNIINKHPSKSKNEMALSNDTENP